MTARQNQPGPESEIPPIGMGIWMLKGGQFIERLEWVIKNGFQGVSFLEYMTDFNTTERNRKLRDEIAAAVKSAGLYLTYHGNLGRSKLAMAGMLDTEFIKRMTDDVIWWHQNTNGVFSCCMDPLHLTGKDGVHAFNYELNSQHINIIAGDLAKYGIRVGMENAFGGKYSAGGKNIYCAWNDFARFKRMCAPGIGMLLDAGHANVHVRSDGVQNEQEIGDFVRGLPLEVLEIHFSDNKGDDDEHRELGYGNLDLRSLFRALKQIRFRGKFTLETSANLLPGQSTSEVFDARQTDPFLISRDRIREMWQACGGSDQ